MKTEKLNKMTAQEAIKKLKDFSSSFEMLGCESGVVAAAIEALEKQISKKPKEKETMEKTHYLCPVCNWIPITIYADGYRLGNQPKYCERCGQKIDWSE